MTQHPNPMTGIADLVSITFDLRALQMEQLTQQAQMGINPQNAANESANGSKTIDSETMGLFGFGNKSEPAQQFGAPSLAAQQGFGGMTNSMAV